MSRHGLKMGVGIIFFCVLVRLNARFGPKQLTFHFFDVGQGDAIGVVFPNSKVWMVDMGGGWQSSSPAEKTVHPFWARQSILGFEKAILTHPDHDHLYGFLRTLGKLKYKQFVFNGASEFTDRRKKEFSTLLTELRENQIPFRFVHRPLGEWEGGVRVLFIPLDGPKVNHRTLVTLFQYSGCNILLTGDMADWQEKALIDSLPRPIHILKVAHHGSRSSSSMGFLHSIQSQVAVISNGHKNIFGHPHFQVSQRLRRKGVEVLRTDFHGRVSLQISLDSRVECQSMQGRCGSFYCATLDSIVGAEEGGVISRD